MLQITCPQTSCRQPFNVNPNPESHVEKWKCPHCKEVCWVYPNGGQPYAKRMEDEE